MAIATVYTKPGDVVLVAERHGLILHPSDQRAVARVGVTTDDKNNQKHAEKNGEQGSAQSRVSGSGEYLRHLLPLMAGPDKDKRGGQAKVPADVIEHPPGAFPAGGHVGGAGWPG